MDEIKKTRGGFRQGAGRPATTVKVYQVCATKEVNDVLIRIKGNRSAFICQCILRAVKAGLVDVNEL